MQEINYLGARKTGEIKIGDNEYFKGENIKIIDDSLFYLDPSTNSNSIISIREIGVIQFKDHFIGSMYGLFTGFGVGALIGIATIDPHTEMAGLAGAAYAGIGGLVCSVYGGIAGVKRKYIFIEDK
jgi:hypothetical protein